MAYQRTEYADKTLSMNSLADRKLRIKLGSIDSHKETIEKEMKRERKKLQKELGGMDDQMRTRLTVSDIGDMNRSPRFTRRYSTPPELLSATLPPSLSDPKRSPLTTRRRLGSDGVSERATNNTPSPISPTSMMFLKAPFDQPRRQSLPPIGDGGLLSTENYSRRDRRGSHSGGTRSPLVTSPTTSGATTPRCLSRKGSSLNEQEMSEVTAKVSRFLQKIDNNKEQIDEKKKLEQKDACEVNQNEEQFDRCQLEVLQKTSSKNQGLFQPLNFE